MTNSTARLKHMMGDPHAQIYTNFNNMAGRMFVAGNGPPDADPDWAQFGFDWFDWARSSAATLVWTEDWCSDAEAYRWSFFASRMRYARQSYLSTICIEAYRCYEFDRNCETSKICPD